jgi:hypothetical protein
MKSLASSSVSSLASRSDISGQVTDQLVEKCDLVRSKTQSQACMTSGYYCSVIP